MRRQYTSRPAFTLTEMMVATALMLFIMVIISTAFRSGIDTFSKLNTTGKLQEQLINAQRIIQRDLGADHFDGSTADGFHGPRLSDQRLDRVGWTPPTNGYFIAWQTGLSTREQATITDGEGLTSTQNTKCFLRFSVKLRTDTPPYDIPMYRFAQSTVAQVQDRTQYPDSILDPIDSPFASRTYYLTSSWAQVEYSMAATGNSTTGNSPLPLFSLRRTVSKFSSTPPPSSTPNVSVASSGPVTPRITRCLQPVPSAVGDDILLTNVLSCEFKYLWAGPTEYFGIVKQPVNPDPSLSTVGFTNYGTAPLLVNSQSMNDGADWPFSDLPLDSSRSSMPNNNTQRANAPKVAWPGTSPSLPMDEDQPLYFDTWYPPLSNVPNPTVPPVDDRFVSGNLNPNATLPNQPPLRIRIKAIQFKIRVWDDKTGQARQITIMQEV